MKTPLETQLSFIGLPKLSGYTIPERPIWQIHNKKLSRIALVCSSMPSIALHWLDWKADDCDVCLNSRKSIKFGIIYDYPIRLRKDAVKPIRGY